jgi:hypothetical protein
MIENAVRIQIAVALIAYLLLRTASLSSFDSSAPISCIEKTPLDSEIPRRPRRLTHASSNSPSFHHEPDSRGTSSAMTMECPRRISKRAAASYRRF